MSKGDLAVFGPKTYILPTRNQSTICLRFCFIIYGRSLGDLSVYLGYKNDTLNNALLWREEGKKSFSKLPYIVS